MTTKIEITADAMDWQLVINELSWMQDAEGQITAEKFEQIDGIYSAAWEAQYGELPCWDEQPEGYEDKPELTIELDEEIAGLVNNIIVEMRGGNE